MARHSVIRTAIHGPHSDAGRNGLASVLFMVLVDIALHFSDICNQITYEFREERDLSTVCAWMMEKEEGLGRECLLIQVYHKKN